MPDLSGYTVRLLAGPSVVGSLQVTTLHALLLFCVLYVFCVLFWLAFVWVPHTDYAWQKSNCQWKFQKKNRPPVDNRARKAEGEGCDRIPDRPRAHDFQGSHAPCGEG